MFMHNSKRRGVECCRKSTALTMLLIRTKKGNSISILVDNSIVRVHIADGWLYILHTYNYRSLDVEICLVTSIHSQGQYC